ncbi:Nucleolar complex-associated [Penicillium griseofulvum]|uniref:Nucleolar complex-associated protein 3 n=1 Tax=Penicillium patulum TaxID=5078 RepID=A0A135LUR8_PENPA|nr:Nucleolar complex-associated [Penicillium griseofulvum]KXG52714.1 Nucleolar complex-associated [Penicillium griseofulvum]
MARGPEVKRRRLSPPADVEKSSSRSRSGQEWDVEQDYECRPRKNTKKAGENARLPIKTPEGFVQAEAQSQDQGEETDSFLGTDDDEEDGSGDEEEDGEESEEEAPKIPLKQQILQAKEDLAKMATLINEDPEEHISLFKTMAEMVSKKNTPITVKKLALASQAAVYKDVIPGYRIRPLSEDDQAGRVSKEVRKLRDFEQSLVSGYRAYVQKLATLVKPAKGDAPTDPGLRSFAISMACTMLLAVPHFNFRSELLKILVNRLARRQLDADYVKCRETMEEIFAKDDDGTVSLEAVRLLAKMLKARDFHIHPTVLDTFLHLRLLGEFHLKASRDRVDREEEEKPHGKKPKQKREFRTKRERKIQKERKEVEKDMSQAEAVVSHEQRDKNQAETLKLVFGLYFRILKLRIPALMGPVLEGLAKYAHLINQDFFGDLLEALKDLINHAEREEMGVEGDQEVVHEEEDEDEDKATIAESAARDARRRTLLCTVTAFALLEGQEASKAAAGLHLDLNFFIKHLYRSLYSLSMNPDVEFNPDTSLRLPDPGSSEEGTKLSETRSKNKVNFQTPMVLLLRCLQPTLLSRAHGNPPPSRLASFSKRLMTTSLQLPEKSALATLALMNQVSKYHGRRISSLWHTEERKGDGVFNAYAADVEATNVFAGTVWEGELLRLHYCPQVREAAVEIEKMMVSSTK